ncbi:hypothetical protein KUCAC02_002650, partial [Chaenocephalus aceratus]
GHDMAIWMELAALQTACRAPALPGASGVECLLLGGMNWVPHILHQWCSDRAWHCARPRCALPNEP